MADRYLVEQLVADGLDVDQAADAADRVLAAIAAMLRAGQYVRIPDVGRLTTKKTYPFVPGSRCRRRYPRRAASLQHPAVIEKGEPYDVL